MKMKTDLDVALDSIAVLVITAEKVAANWELSEGDRSFDHFSPTLSFLWREIDRLTDRSDIRRQWARAVRKACEGSFTEFSSMLDVAVGSVEELPAKQRIWKRGRTLMHDAFQTSMIIPFAEMRT